MRFTAPLLPLALIPILAGISGCGGGSIGSGHPAGLNSIQHIVFLAQENRSFDQYFGALRAYWAANGYPDQSFDGLPQFNPISGPAPLQGPVPTNPGCDPKFPPPNGCVFDPNISVSSFHFKTECAENPSP